MLTKAAHEIAESKGFYENIRKPLSAFLIALFLIAPWITIHNEPLIMLDVLKRNFILFGFHFFSHDAPLLFFLIISFVFTVALVTAIWGRMWCGWACPQTVFLSGVYLRLETLIMGNYLERIKKKNQKLSASRVLQSVALYVSWILVSYLISHSVLAYFVSGHQVLLFLKEGPEKHISLFVVLQVITLLVFINFAWFRHRFCNLVCPYGRFQNILLDQNTLSATYLKHVGEPRRGTEEAKNGNPGECVNCLKCVNVCPMKIDIRNGFQLECINCAACVDSCNEIMAKLKRPFGLIQFATADGKPISFKRFRILLYAGIICLAFAFLVVQLLDLKPVQIEISRASQNIFNTEKSGEELIISNHFKISFKNQKNEVQTVKLGLSEESIKNKFEMLSPYELVELKPLEQKEIHIFVKNKTQQGQLVHPVFDVNVTGSDLNFKKSFKLLGGSE